MTFLKKLLMPCLGILLFIAYWAMFKGFFSPGHGIGHDYSFFLPQLLDGFYWYKNNGILSPPWFTPAFCAGIPYFADPQGIFYSPQQFLTFFTNPLNAVFIALLGAAAGGFGGMYAFCRRKLKTDPMVAFLASAVWLFNGFTTHHYLVGHVGFLWTFLAPVIACLIVPSSNAGPSKIAFMSRAGLAGLLIAGCLHAGLGTLMVPFALSVWAMCCIAVLRGSKCAPIYGLAASSGLLASCLAASKVVAVSSLMQHLSHSQYPLPGISSLDKLLAFTFGVLTRPDEDLFPAFDPLLINRAVSIAPHELAFDLTPIPFLLIGVAAGSWLIRHRFFPKEINSEQWLHGSILLVLTLIPLGVLYYTPVWNTFLKGLPILSSTTSPWRWLVLLLPVICCASALSLQALISDKKLRAGFAMALILALVALKATAPREYYAHQPYDAAPILAAYEIAQASDFYPEIRHIGTYVDEEKVPVRQINQNDLLTRSISQAFCYNPLFGYALEDFPVGDLRPGNPLKASNGKLNLKNPACYVFPTENHCQPGEHFAYDASGIDRASRLLRYQPWNFERSQRQHYADAVTLIAIALSLIFILLQAAQQLLLWKKKLKNF